MVAYSCRSYPSSFRVFNDFLPKLCRGTVYLYPVLKSMHCLEVILRKWKAFAKWVGVAQTTIILTIFYFVFLLPLGLIFTLFQDGLGIKKKAKSTWRYKDKQASLLSELQDQF